MPSRWWPSRWRSNKRQAEIPPRPAEQPPPGGVERRQAPRQPADLTACCRLVTLLAGDSWPARIHDTSATGIGLLLLQPFPPGTFLSVQVQDASLAMTLGLLVKVVRISRTADSQLWLLGCQILRELPPKLDAEAETNL